MRRAGRTAQVAAAFTVLIAVLAMSGCGTAVLSPVYVAEGYASVYLVQCTSNGDSISGSFTYASLTFKSDKVESGTLAFTGTQSGSHVSLTVNEGLGLTMNIAGELSGSHLKLAFKSDNGVMQTLDVAPSSLDEYNAAVARLQNQVIGTAD